MTEVSAVEGERAVPRWRALVPLILLAAALFAFSTAHEEILGLVGSNPPAADAVDVRRVEFKAGAKPEIRMHVTNPQREPLSVAVVTVNTGVVGFSLDGPAELGRLDSRVISIPYHWDVDEPYSLSVTTGSGVETVHDVPAAVETHGVTAKGVLGFGLIGLLVGLLPVALGMLWLPSLRGLSQNALAGFMALTAGLLSFLAVDALFEALEVQAQLPSAFAGLGLVMLGLAASFIGLGALSDRLKRSGEGKHAGLALATAVAVGIGLHNLGEGLAIGSSFALGSLALGSLLIIGFTVHNITEGLAIVAPLASGDERVAPMRLVLLAAIAGLPAVLGAWIGGFLVSQLLGVFFFAVAAGAAAQVVYEVAGFIRERQPGGWRTPTVAVGFVAGVAIMWVTSLLIG